MIVIITTSLETKVLSKENLFIKEYTGNFSLLENIISKIKTAFFLLPRYYNIKY